MDIQQYIALDKELLLNLNGSNSLFWDGFKWLNSSLELDTEQKANIFEQEIINQKMDVFSDTSQEYLDSIEIQTIISLLKIIRYKKLY